MTTNDPTEMSHEQEATWQDLTVATRNFNRILKELMELSPNETFEIIVSDDGKSIENVAATWNV